MTIAQLQAETRRIYKVYRSYGWQPGAAEQEAAEFYAYQLTRLRLRKLEAAREAAEIETVCAWCGTHISGVEGATPEHVSHGICPECEAREFPAEVTE